jgi:hypothetical protein
MNNRNGPMQLSEKIIGPKVFVRFGRQDHFWMIGESQD